MSPDKVEWKADTPEIVVQRVSQIEGIVRTVIKNVMQVIEYGVIERTPIGDPRTDWHYGQLKASWTPVQETEGGFSFSTDIPYAYVLEKGRYKNLGPRTVTHGVSEIYGGGSGIFSSQAPGGMIAPIVTNQVLMDTITKNVVTTILGKMGKRGKSA